MSLEVTKQELLKQAIYLNKLYATTRNQEYKDQETRIRKIVVELEALLIGTSNVANLDDLSDVTISAPANAQVLTYNSTTSQWENQTPASSGGTGDMSKSTYDVDNDGVVDSAERTEIIVRNSTGVTLTKGQVVYLSGATGNRPNALLSQAHTEATSSKTIGIVVANIANNSDGYVATNGTLHDLDTSAFADGAAVWLSAATAGAMTSTIPSEPNHTVFIGYVARSHPTQGRLVILIQNGYELNELHGVLIASEANNDLLTYESSTGLWKNKTFSAIFGGTPLVSVPTLAQVTTAGNTTTNAITVGGLVVDTNTLVVDSVNDRVVIGATTATNKLEIFGTGTSGGVSSNVGYNIQPVVRPVITGVTYALQAGTALEIGTYYYRVTYYNAIGETNASLEIPVITTAGNTIVQLNNIPISTDASVIGRKIYRGKVTDGISYGVVIATLANNTTTTYTDSTPDTNPIFSGSVLTRRIEAKANTTARYIAVSGTRSMILDPSLTTFGVNAGAAITVAPNVSLFGVNAGQNITYGGGNTLFGAYAGITITGGFQNVAIGEYALSQVTTGSYNIGIGPFTNSRNNSFSIALGYYTGNSTTGDRNVLIGGYIGSSTLAMADSVIIGHNATPLAATNNQINIANTIYGRSNTGNVQIGTTTDAGYKLDVNGTGRFQGSANTIPLTISGYSVTGTNTTRAIDLTGTWNTSGSVTALSIDITNTASGANSNLINASINGSTNIFSVRRDGSVLAQNTFAFHASSGTLIGSASLALSTGFGQQTGIIAQRSQPISATTGDFFTLSVDSVAGNASTNTFIPTSGTATYTAFRVVPTINQTGGANGITRGIYVNPTLTSAADFRAIQTVVGNVLLCTTSGNVGIGTTSPSTTLDVNGTIKATSYNVGGVAGFTGTFTVMTNPPGQQNLNIVGGIITSIT